MKKFLLLPLVSLLACAVVIPAGPPSNGVEMTPRWLLSPVGLTVANACVSRNSSYVFHRTELRPAGDSDVSCGPIVDNVVYVDADGIVSPLTSNVLKDQECTNGPSGRVEGCKVFTEITCRNSMGVVRSFHGWMNWEADGSRGQGMSTVGIQSPTGVCHSTYIVFATRL